MSAYRDELSALSARHEALTAELTHKAREVEAAAALLKEARARVNLPVLDHIRIAAPCKAGWENMVGDDKVRFCGLCQKNVYNLSELTRAEAEALILEKEGDLCGRYYQRKDGTILTKDCSVGVAQRRKRRVFAFGAAGAAMLAGTGAFLAVHHEETYRASFCEEKLKLTPADDELELLTPPPSLQSPPPPTAPRERDVEVDGAIAISPELYRELQERRQAVRLAQEALDEARDRAEASLPPLQQKP